MLKNKKCRKFLISSLIFMLIPFSALACKDAVVLVHGNTATPASWDNTYNHLLSNGYSPSDIYRPDWGNTNSSR